jgi:hypothetical protein
MTIEEDRDRIRRIARNILERTEAGELTWQRGEERSLAHQMGLDVVKGRHPRSPATTFRLRLESGYSVIIASEDADHEPPYLLLLRNPKGIDVESLRTRFSKDARGGSDASAISIDNALLKQLYFAARERALRIGDALSAVERDLGLS